MTRILVLDGHPAPASLCRSLAQRYADAAREAGHELRVVHLHDLDFDADDVWTDSAIYDADPADIVESINAVPDDVSTLVVVGHAPGIPALALDLADHLPEHQEDRPDDGWPPAAVAVVGHRGTWAQFPGQDTAVVAFHRP